MKKSGQSLEFSATDLVGYLNCQHLSGLDRAVAEGTLEKPKVWDPLLEILWERGSIHERKYVEHLTKTGLEIVAIDGVDVTDDAVAQTLTAMNSGAQAIVQGALSHEAWSGRADILRRVKLPSDFGKWSYEVIDTKLARETKAGTILQLCLYSDLLTEAQGIAPEYMYVVAPWSEFKPQQFRFADYSAYFRRVKQGMLTTHAEQEKEETYPDPKEHCDICRWRETCDKRRRNDDHLCLVAGITKLQINELKQRGIATVQSLAVTPLPLDWKPDRGSYNSYGRIREQARIQVEARETLEQKFELLPVENGFGLTCLPEPSEGDIFFDLESDPFVGEHGLEYLFGYVFSGEYGDPEYHSDWAFTRGDEKLAFESFVDFVIARWKRFPGMHIYHYAPYEQSALKRLMGRYATREKEIDRMFRAKLFVDLYQVVRNGIRAGVESYSIKRLEPFYTFERKTVLADANVALANLQANLELDDIPSITEQTKDVIRTYNKDDCDSATALRDWLETLRTELIAAGTEVLRPEPGNDGAPNEKINDWLIKIYGLIDRLIADIPADPEERDSANVHPQAVFAHKNVEAQVMADSLVRIGEYVAEHGLHGEGSYQAARDLLLMKAPRIGGQELHRDQETTVGAAVRLCEHLAGGILPIQGPPGAGKTFTGACMACELARQGKTVGITANSHKVIRNLIDAIVEAADENGVELQCCQKVAEVEKPQHRLSFVKKNEDLFASLGNNVAVGGGTAWLWSRPDAFETIDVLFVDEAAQMSLANVLAVSQAANTVVLIGDPQQLDQPTQGSHPEGTDTSALDHILSGKKTIGPEQGLFLEETWRLHPKICSYTSELFYDGKLGSKEGLEQQVVNTPGPISGAGLYYVPVEHEGNQNCSPEEAQAIGNIVNGIVESKATWVDREGQEMPVTLDDSVPRRYEEAEMI